MLATRLGQIFSLSWLLLFVPAFVPLVSKSDTYVLSVALGLFAFYAATYSWFVFRVAWGSRSRRDAVAAYTVLMVLSSVFAFAPPLNWFGAFVFPATIAAVVLPLRLATPAVLLATGLAAFAMSASGLALTVAVSMSLQVVLFAAGGRSFGYIVQANRELRAARLAIARLAVDEERLRFARDLHDLLGHSLSLIALKSELAGKVASSDAARAVAEMEDVERVAREALREVRQAVSGYRQPDLAAEVAAARVALAAAGISCVVSERGSDMLPAPVQALLAWAVREGVTNVVRHSRAARCVIRIARDVGTADVEVTDDGMGGVPVRGAGLLGLAERVAARGGSVDASPLPTSGFRLRVSVPLGAP